MGIDARRFKTAEEASTEDRAIGAALGSGTSNFVTGTLASPFLFAEKNRFRMKSFRKGPVKHLRKIYGMDALGKGLALAGVSMVGGAMKEHVQAKFEKTRKKKASEKKEPRINARLHSLIEAARRHSGALIGGGVGAGLLGMASQRRLGAAFGGVAGAAAGAVADHQEKTGTSTSSSGHSGDLLRVSAPVSATIGAGKELGRRRPKRKKQASQFGIMVYQRDPNELPESKRPSNPKGRIARMFGAKLSPTHALHRRAKRHEDEWMGENGEFVEIGRRPGVMDALQEVVGIEPNQVMTRQEVMKLVQEKGEAKKGAFALRRARRKAKEHVHMHAPDDLSEVMKVFEDLLENPQAKYFQVVG